jgi:hypothetical protein
MVLLAAGKHQDSSLRWNDKSGKLGMTRAGNAERLEKTTTRSKNRADGLCMKSPSAQI